MTKIWYNTLLVESELAPIHDGWMLGRGIFETIRTIDGIPLALSRHMRRAMRGGKVVGIRLPSEEDIHLAIGQVIDSNPFSNGRLRISFADDGTWIATHDEYLEIEKPARLRVESERIDSEKTPPKKFPYSYRLSILERAQSDGFDDAIVCNSRNNICESSISNLLLYIDGEWVTPPLSNGILAGVMRALVIENLEVAVRKVKFEELDSISGCLLLSSLKIALSVESIGDRKLPEIEVSQRLGAQIRAMVIASSVR